MNRAALKNTTEVLKILYMVVAGLAIAKGFELFVPSNNGPLKMGLATITTWSFWFFMIFFTTVIRFVHGAMRHFDKNYIEEPHRANWKIAQPIWDFAGLAFEAFIFFILAFSIDNYFHFIHYYLILLIADCIWLFIIIPPPITKIWTGHSKNWIKANLIVLCSTGIPMLWLTKCNNGICPKWLFIIFIVGTVIHSAMDYSLNWKFYFGTSWKEQNHE